MVKMACSVWGVLFGFVGFFKIISPLSYSFLENKQSFKHETTSFPSPLL